MTKKKLSIKKIDGVHHYYVDGEETTIYQYHNAYAQNLGVKNHYHLARKRGYKGFNHEMDEFRLKTTYDFAPEGLVSIPSAPDYYANREGQVWCLSDKRKCWIQITSYRNPNNNGYCSVQPYINGKRYVKYVHRLVAEAFHGEIPDDCEVNHIDRNTSNNHINNLEILTKEIHRKMKKVRKSK